MFTCFSLHSGERINILTTEWRNQLNGFRRLSSENQLVCQGCKQPVRVKAGRKKRWHFAHKHLHNCPFEKISTELMAARSAFYDWLVSLYGEGAVELEVFQPNLRLPKPIDLILEINQTRCAFWFVETRMTPALRESVMTGLTKLNAPFMFIFLDRMHRPLKDKDGMVILSTTEREFAKFTEYDLIHHPINKPLGKSLHYFGTSEMKITTYRDLECVHKPQIYHGRNLSTEIDKIQVDVGRNSIVHPGEGIEVEKVLSKINHRQKKLDDSRKIFGDVLNRMLPQKESSNQPTIRGDEPEDDAQKRSPIPKGSQRILNEPAECMFCGQITDDWWYLDRSSGLCKCRTCLRRNADQRSS